MLENAISNTNIAMELVTSHEYLTFRINDEDYGIDINSIMEIKAWTCPTSLPNVPDFLLGVINVRGMILPIFDLKKRFGMGFTEQNEKRVIIFVKYHNKSIGVLVDAVSDIISINKDAIREAPDMEGEIRGEFIEGLVGLNSKMIIILNIDRLFSEIELNQRV